VLIDDALKQLPNTDLDRGLSRFFRIGPAMQPHDAETYQTLERAFHGIGLRPYAPAHLHAERSGETIDLRWTRRTRVGGDSWENEPPLSEEIERYVITVKASGETKTLEATVPNITLSAPAPATITVAQVSAHFGPGLSASITV